MKKTLIALAVLASGAAFAQSSVTLYGVLDIGYSKTNVPAKDASDKLGMSNGGTNFHTPSVIGFKGSEDLGGGLKANFNLQSGGLDLADGSTSVAFSREAWAGISGGFGSTRFGRTSSVATQAMGSFDLNGIAASSAMSNVNIGPVTWYGSSRRSSQFQYSTNSMSGFDAGLGVVLSGDNGGVAAPKAYYQGRANYANGPISAGFTIETAHAAANRTAYAVAGAYDFGAAKVTATYAVAESEALGKGLHIGVKAPLGAAYVGAQYAKNTTTKDSAIEAFAGYNFSKRTQLYLDLVRVNYSNTATTDVTKYGVGIVHTF
jgi:predicted porin